MISFFYLELVFSSLWWFLWLCFICVPKIYSQEISLDFSTSNNNGRSFRLSMRFFLKCVWHLVFSRQVYYAFNVHLPNSIVIFIMTKTSVYVFVLIHLLCPVFYFSHPIQSNHYKMAIQQPLTFIAFLAIVSFFIISVLFTSLL